MTAPLVGSPLRWARDFGIIGAATGSLAPFFVIFDPFFALAAGFMGAVAGAWLGGGLGWTIEHVRGRVPLAVMVPIVAVLGSLWGASTGVIGGAAGWMFPIEAGVAMGFVLGGTTGMVALAALFLPYLLAAVRGNTWPVVLAAVGAAPFMGWAGLAALGASTFGLWLLALPAFLALGVLLDRSEQRAVRRAQSRSIASSSSMMSGPIPTATAGRTALGGGAVAVASLR